jgi:integrase
MSGHKELRGKGVWRLCVSTGLDAEGNRIRYRKTFKGTATEAEKELSMFYADVVREDYQKPSRMIVKDLFRKWLDTYGKLHLKSLTLETDERYLMERVAPMPFGKLQVSKLTSTDFYRLYNDLQTKHNYSDKTLLQIHRIMHSAFSEAMGWSELRLRHHPMQGVKAPKPEQKNIVRLKDDEVTIFLKAALKHAPFWFFTFLCVDFLAGLRRGEICGLRWIDLDPKRRKIHVRQSILRIKGEGLIEEPTKSGKQRTASAPEDLFVVLDIYRNVVTKEKGIQADNALIFSKKFGVPFSPDDVSHYMKKFREKHGLPNVTIHGGRHSNASMLINRGATLKEVAGQLGHSTTQITDTIYTEVWEERQTAIADCLKGIIPDLAAKDEPTKSNIIRFPKRDAR